MTQSQERYRKACMAAAVGTIIVALCCFTPLLVLVLGIVGLSFPDTLPRLCGAAGACGASRGHHHFVSEVEEGGLSQVGAKHTRGKEASNLLLSAKSPVGVYYWPGLEIPAMGC